MIFLLQPFCFGDNFYLNINMVKIWRFFNSGPWRLTNLNAIIIDFQIIKKYNEENVLNLNEKQICTVIDYIIDEMLKYNNNNSTISQKESTANASELINSHSQTLTMLTISHKRIQLLVRFFKNNNVINKTQFFNLILDHLKKQREQLNRFSIIIQNPKNSITDDDYYTMRSNFINSMQRIILFAIYTEDDSIMNHIDNPDRIFSNLYNQINQPTSVNLEEKKKCFSNWIKEFNFLLFF